MLDHDEIKSCVDRHLTEAREMMLPRVQAAFDEILRERKLLTSDRTPYFDAFGHPLFELPVWVANRLRGEGAEIPAEVLADVLGCSTLGYFHIRAQDDWLDAEGPPDPTLIALSEALLAMCNRLLAATVGSSTRFWNYYSEVITAYAESMLHTAHVRTSRAPITQATFERLLHQCRPLVLPTAALLDRADRWSMRPELEEFVFAATATSQIFNDLTDLFRDCQSGQRTWTAEKVGDDAPERLWSEVLHAQYVPDPGPLQERIDAALVFHQRSARAAQSIGRDRRTTLADRSRGGIARCPGRTSSQPADRFHQTNG